MSLRSMRVDYHVKWSWTTLHLVRYPCMGRSHSQDKVVVKYHRVHAAGLAW